MEGSDKYHVVGCSNCDNIWVVDGKPQTTTCTLCNERHKTKKLKKFFSSENKEKAVQARTIKQARVNGVEHIYQELLNDDFVDEEIKKAIAGEDISKNNNNSSPSNKDAVRKSIKKLDEPKDEDVIRHASSRYDIEPEEVEKIIDRLCMNGEAMRKRNGEIKIIM